jgi:hypothetical protein
MFHIRNGWKEIRCSVGIAFQLSLEYAIRSVQVNRDGWNLKGTHQLLVYADDVNIMGGSVHTMKNNSAA